MQQASLLGSTWSKRVGNAMPASQASMHALCLTEDMQKPGIAGGVPTCGVLLRLLAGLPLEAGFVPACLLWLDLLLLL